MILHEKAGKQAIFLYILSTICIHIQHAKEETKGGPQNAMMLAFVLGERRIIWTAQENFFPIAIELMAAVQRNFLYQLVRSIPCSPRLRGL